MTLRARVARVRGVDGVTASQSEVDFGPHRETKKMWCGWKRSWIKVARLLELNRR